MTATWAPTAAPVTVRAVASEHPKPAQPPAESDAGATERRWRLMPAVSTRQLVVVVGFIAVLAYGSSALVTGTLLLRTRLGHAWPVIVAAAGLGAGAVCGLVGLLILAVMRLRTRRRSSRTPAAPRVPD